MESCKLRRGLKTGITLAHLKFLLPTLGKVLGKRIGQVVISGLLNSHRHDNRQTNKDNAIDPLITNIQYYP